MLKQRSAMERRSLRLSNSDGGEREKGYSCVAQLFHTAKDFFRPNKDFFLLRGKNPFKKGKKIN